MRITDCFEGIEPCKCKEKGIDSKGWVDNQVLRLAEEEKK
jgi:hypothetical protein